MSKEQETGTANLIKELKRQVEEAEELKKSEVVTPQFEAWKAATQELIKKATGENSNYLQSFNNLRFWPDYKGAITRNDRVAPYKKERHIDYTRTFLSSVETAQRIIQSLMETVELIGAVEHIREIEYESKDQLFNINVINNNLNQLLQVSDFNAMYQKITNMNISEKEKQEAKEKIKDLEEELKKHEPKWDKIGKTLTWSLGFSKDIFLSLLPWIIQNYQKFC